MQQFVEGVAEQLAAAQAAQKSYLVENQAIELLAAAQAAQKAIEDNRRF